MSNTQVHIPVLRDEALDSLRIVENGVYVDGTFGRGGHTRELLSRLGAEGCLLAIDADPVAIDFARANFEDDPRFTITHNNFANLTKVCDTAGYLGRVDGVLLDLGVSSPQLDEPERGFSFQHDGPLDMRMDPSCGESAADWLARAPESEIADIFWRYGEERYSRRIAHAIVEKREQKPFRTTLAFSEAVKTAHPRWEKHKHPATRIFQAVRIHINRELESLSAALESVVDVLKVGGRLAVISFHSLEDRAIKRFARGDHKKAAQPRGLPIPNNVPDWPLRQVGKKIRPSQREIDANPRARSAVLRVVEKIG